MHATPHRPPRCRETEFFIDILLVRIHLTIEMIWWTGLALWKIEFPFVEDKWTQLP